MLKALFLEWNLRWLTACKQEIYVSFQSWSAFLWKKVSECIIVPINEMVVTDVNFQSAKVDTAEAILTC